MNVDYAPEYLYDDVQSVVAKVHTSGKMHQIVSQDPERFLDAELTRKHLPSMLNQLGNVNYLSFSETCPFILMSSSSLLSESVSHDE